MRRTLLTILTAGLLAGCGSATTETVTTHVAPGPGHPLPAAPRHETGAGGTQCGTERWAVKTLSDPSAGNVRPEPRDTTIAALTAIPVPADLTDRVSGPETTTWRLANVHLESFKREADSDYHLTIADDQGDALLNAGASWTDPRLRGHTMIAEPFDPACAPTTDPGVRTASAAVRAHIDARFGPPTDRYRDTPGARITLQGVGFFDRIHGQRGVAPNGFELHPVTADP